MPSSSSRSSSSSNTLFPIRAVVNEFPKSAQVWDETSLPLAVTLQPLASINPTRQDNDYSYSNESAPQQQQQKRYHDDNDEEEEEDNDQRQLRWSNNNPAMPPSSDQQARRVTSVGSSGSFREDMDDSTMTTRIRYAPPMNQNQPLLLLSTVPKCLQCGAPHPTRQTHYHPSSSSSSSSRSSFRQSNTPFNRHLLAESDHHNNNNMSLLCHLCGQTSSYAPAAQRAARHRHEPDVEWVETIQFPRQRDYSQGLLTVPHCKDTTVFALPLHNITRHNVDGRIFDYYRQRYQHDNDDDDDPTRGNAYYDNDDDNTALFYRVPATVCPLYWFVILDASDISSLASTYYWRTVHDLLSTCWNNHQTNNNNNNGFDKQQTNADNNNNTEQQQQQSTPIPEYVHVSLILLSSEHVSIFQLDQATPQLQHYPLDQLTQQQQESSRNIWFGGTAILQEDDPTTELAKQLFYSPVPMRQAQLQTSVQCLLNVQSCFDTSGGYYQNPTTSPAADATTNNNNNPGMPLFWFLSLLSDSLLTYGHAAGQPRDTEEICMPYAGAQVSVLLSQPPNHYDPPGDAHVAQQEQQGDAAYHPLTTLSRGVLGGRALPAGTVSGSNPQRTSATRTPGRRFSRDDNADGDNDDMVEDWFPEAMQEQYPPAKEYEWIQAYGDLGRQCADAAMAVDILAMTSHSDESTATTADKRNNQHQDFGLTLMAGLFKCSGGHGTAVYPIGPHATTSAKDALNRTWQSRLPWNRDQRGYGVELRLRCSPGYQVDTSAVTDRGEEENPLAELFHQAGLTGPAFVEEEGLWTTACCDPDTTFSVDLMVSPGRHRHQHDHHTVGGITVPLRPVVQTCLAYTAIEKVVTTGANENDEPVVRYYTVRRMRISSKTIGKIVDQTEEEKSSLTVPNETERLYNSLDTEAAAIVLFHKLALASFQEGTDEVRPIAEEWLQTLLECVYKSALAMNAEVEEEQRNVLLPQASHAHGGNTSDLPFVASERLVGRGARDLGDVDILLAQGHAHLQSIPLMIYMLLQTDAFSIDWSSPTSFLSLDDRFSALSQLTSMPPHTFTRCLAPRLQLWAGVRQGEEDEGQDELLVDLIQLKMEEIQWAIQEQRKRDAASLFLLVDCPSAIMVVQAHLLLAASSSMPPSAGTAAYRPGRGLERAIELSASSYQIVRPPICFVTDESDAKGLQLFRRLVYVEDTPLGGAGVEGSDSSSFSSWRQSMAKHVNEQLENPSNAFVTDGAIGA